MSAAALRADGAGDSTPGSDAGARITRLFPKCRPKNMQHDRLNSGLEGRENNVNNISSDEERESQLVILNSKGGTYKLRDSRIIEIAGGRELYSQSRTKAVRKLRHNSAHKHNIRNKVRLLNKDPVDYDQINHEISLHRINSEPKKMISRHTSPTYTNGDKDGLESRDSMGIPRNSSPILDPHKTTDVSTKSSPIAVVADGEVVVFDDNDDWKVILNSVSLGLRTEPDASDNEIDISVKRTIDTIKNGDSDVNNKSEVSEGSGSCSREDVRLSDASPSGAWLSGDEDKSRVTRVIGELPIAEYEGSPRRYGVGSQKATNRSPRPGFPQRVVTESRDITPPTGSATFDYLYEFSETRKVLEEFFKCPSMMGQMALNGNNEIVNFQDLDYELRRQAQECPSENGLEGGSESEWPQATETVHSPHATHNHTNFLGLQQHKSRYPEPNVSELSVGGAWSGSPSPPAPRDRVPFALSTDTSDSGSDLSLMIMENELSELKVDRGTNSRPGALGHKETPRDRNPFVIPPNNDESGSDSSITKDNLRPGLKVQMDPRAVVTLPIVEDGLSSSGNGSDNDNNNQNHSSVVIQEIVEIMEHGTNTDPHILDADLHSLDPLARGSPPPPAPQRAPSPAPPASPSPSPSPCPSPSPAHAHAHDTQAPHHHHHDDVYPPRKRPSSAQSQDSVDIKPASGDEDEADTDLETDRLLGQQRTDDQGFFDEKGWRKPKSRTVMPAMPAGSVTSAARSPHAHEPDNRDEEALHNGKDKDVKKKSKNKEVLIEGVLFRARYLGSTQLACEGQPTKATRMLQAEEAVSRIKWGCDGPYSGVYAAPAAVFRLSFLGSVEVEEDSRRRKKRPKKNMVEEAVTKIKAPEGENQPSTEVDLFISTEKIMVLNTELKEIMMDHALRTISYIADIGDLVVLMARRRFVPHESDSDQPKLNRTPKMICHVFESEEAQFIAQSIGQAFQVAYMEFLKANGIEDHSFVKEMDYQEVLNSQEIFGDELQMFAKKELQKEVVVPKTKGEILGVVVVESGWGSMLPTVVIANLAPAGAAARCGQLNIGDQIIAINGVSLVGLPLSTCQTYIKNSKNQTVVKLTVVPCAPVVEVKIKRPDTKYQLGFSVQNGVICSLLRGGIAERGGVRVGHRIIEINSQSVVAVPHERIVNLLATSVGEILMKTMPTSMFRLLTGQENPVFI
ncbi:uncharacterized protein LOC128681970 isoform X3 [Plodia interpunctella]|uniref:uncharacterized protein LOC128681970 isoform X3 n=1 Tax=Plodia interpunctella TaxID=58824 RepID=UPI002368184A|nr:uncharacterized protein LOC128681970 isoform X3 [Plodia interpunctella]